MQKYRFQLKFILTILIFSLLIPFTSATEKSCKNANKSSSVINDNKGVFVVSAKELSVYHKKGKTILALDKKNMHFNYLTKKNIPLIHTLDVGKIKNALLEKPNSLNRKTPIAFTLQYHTYLASIENVSESSKKLYLEINNIHIDNTNLNKNVITKKMKIINKNSSYWCLEGSCIAIVWDGSKNCI